MSARGPKRVVLNSHRLFRDISPQIIRELEPEALEMTPSDPELYATIQGGNHRIILTDRLRDEYPERHEGKGFPPWCSVR